MWGTFTQPCEEGIDIFYTHNTVNGESCTGQSKIHQITSTTQSLIPCPWDMSVWSSKRKVKRKRCMSQQGKTRKASLMSHHPLIGRWALANQHTKTSPKTSSWAVQVLLQSKQSHVLMLFSKQTVIKCLGSVQSKMWDWTQVALFTLLA